MVIAGDFAPRRERWDADSTLLATWWAGVLYDNHDGEVIHLNTSGCADSTQVGTNL